MRRTPLLPFRRELTEASRLLQAEVDAAGVRLMAFAATASISVALGLGIVRFATGSGNVIAWAPWIAGALFTWQALTGASRMGIAIEASIIGVAIGYNVSGSESTLLPSALALVMLGTVGVILVSRGLAAMVGLTVASMVFSGLTWVDDGPDRAALMGTMLAGYLVAGLSMAVVRAAATVAVARYQRLFEASPTALIEQDWSGVVRKARKLAVPADATLNGHLLANPDVVADLVHEAVYVKANEAAAELTGGARSSDELLGRMPRSRVNETSLPAMAAQIVAMVEGEESFEAVYQTRNYEGTPVWVDVRWIRSPGFTANPDSVVTAIRDITDEVEARKAAADLMKAKDEFIASVSHELRTPLTAIVGLADELNSSYEELDEMERRELISLVASQSHEMASIVEDLLVAARADIDQITVIPEEISVTENLERVIKEFGWAETIDRPTGDCRAFADPIRFRQIMRNLIANAHRYGGKERRVIGSHDGELITIEVRDSGSGVPSADREMIFEPYSRAHSTPGVTASVGLGLAVSRRLARLMDGDLTYNYDPAAAESVFRLTLPAASPGADPDSCN